MNQELLEKYRLLRAIPNCYEEMASVRVALIKHARTRRMPYQLIAQELGHSTGYIARLHIYKGTRAFPSTIRLAKVRDNFTCQKCGHAPECQSDVQAHHIDKPTDHSLKNLITLCSPCHGLVHREKNRARKAVRARKWHAVKI